MTRARLLSGLVGAGLLAAVAGGQEPKGKEKKADPPAPPKQVEVELQFDAATIRTTRPAPPAKGSLEEAIQTAMQRNPDVRVAEAEAQLAQARVNQVRAKVAQQVSAARAAVDAAKRGVKSAEAEYQAVQAARAVAEDVLGRFKQLGRGGLASQELAQAEAGVAAQRMHAVKAAAQIEAAKAAVANAEAELNGILGGTPGQPAAAADAAVRQWNVVRSSGSDRIIDIDFAVDLAHAARVPAAPPGSVADRLKAALDKPVKLPESKDVTIEQALTVALKAAGVEVQVRMPPTEDPAVVKQPVRLRLRAAELPLSTWLELIADDAAQELNTGELNGRPKRYEFYLREYGLLVSDPTRAPADAVSVPQFVRQVRAEKAKEKKDTK